MSNDTFRALGLLKGELKRHTDATHRLQDAISAIEYRRPSSEQVTKPQADKWAAQRQPKSEETKRRMSLAQKRRFRRLRSTKGR